MPGLSSAVESARGQHAARAFPVTLLALVAVAAACASPGLPRGAPLDELAPEIVRTNPDSARTNFSDREIEFVFDEVVSERPSGVTDLASLILISPEAGVPRVAWKRRALTVRPREGWLPGTTYTVTLLPGVMDLQNNVRRDASTLVFSTGDSLDTSRISGILFDWMLERPAARALVQAVRVDDSAAVATTQPGRRDTVRYWAVTDTAGKFVVANLPRGSYMLLGFIDGNANRSLDRIFEKYDTAFVTVSDSARVEFLAFAHDSLAPLLDIVAVRDSFTISARFHRPVDPAQQIDSASFTLVAADDSSEVQIVLARPERAFERRGGAGEIAGAAAGGGAQQGAPTEIRQAVAPSRPAPPQVFIIQVATPLVAGKRYILRTGGIRGLLGVSKEADERPIDVPPRAAPPARVDTSGARAPASLPPWPR
jgi:hypothetical protein